MILVVDDDRDLLDLITGILRGAGYPVHGVDRADAALAWLEGERPSLIISDILMPGRDGFAFRQEVAHRYPNRPTPFLFLSSLDDPQTMVSGLDLGADDYLVKPIHPEVLKAKVRSLLRRRERYRVGLFDGALSRFPFGQLLQFCEVRGLTGEVEVEDGGFRGTVRFERGELVYDATVDALLETLMDLRQGTFRIRIDPVDFADLEHASLPGPTPDPSIRPSAGRPGPSAPEADSAGAAAAGAGDRRVPLPMEERPMGQLSGVRVGERLFQVQTEYVTAPEAQIVTIVILDGRTVQKRVGAPAAGAARDALAQSMREQHAAVEREVRERVASLGQRPAVPDVPSLQVRFNRLFEEGLDHYQAKEYAKAIAVWERAAELDPDNKTLAVNLRIVRKKLESPDRRGPWSSG